MNKRQKKNCFNGKNCGSRRIWDESPTAYEDALNIHKDRWHTMYSALCIFKLFVCTYYIHQSSQCHQEEAFSINFIFMILKILRLTELNNLYTRESGGVNTKS